MARRLIGALFMTAHGNMLRMLWCAILALAVCHGAARAEQAGRDLWLPDTQIATLIIETAPGVEQRFVVEMMRTPEAQAMGMMHRRWLAPQAGMAFPFPAPRRAHFWMKNTLLPLDMIFIRADSTVESVAAMTEPLSEATWSSVGPVVMVLEINGGLAAKHGIDAGDRVYWE